MESLEKKECSEKESFLKNVYNDSYLLNIGVAHIAPLIKKYLTKNVSLKGRLVDVGCGNGSVLRYLRDHFQGRFEYSGIDILENSDQENPHPIHFIQGDLNKICLVNNEKFDLVISCEVIEHLIDTDDFVLKIKGLLKPGGILIMTTPNLASFYNRILLLFGYQPLHTEVSWQNPYIGRESLYKLIGQGKSPTAGHLRLFTSYALKMFLKYHGFDVVKRSGFSTYGGFMGAMSRLFTFMPSLMPGLFVVARTKL